MEIAISFFLLSGTLCRSSVHRHYINLYDTCTATFSDLNPELV